MDKYRFLIHDKATHIVLPKEEIKLYKLRNRFPDFAKIEDNGDTFDCYDIDGAKLGRFALIRGHLTREDLAYFIVHTVAKQWFFMGKLLNMGETIGNANRN